MIKNPSGPVCDSDNEFIARKANVFSTVFSNGPASYFYDALEELLFSTFQTDLQADFDYFVSLSVTKPKISTQPKGVDLVGITKGLNEDFWLNKNLTGTPADFMKMYTKSDEKAMNIRSFGYFEILYFTRKATSIMNCTHCLVEVKK